MDFNSHSINVTAIETTCKSGPASIIASTTLRSSMVLLMLQQRDSVVNSQYDLNIRDTVVRHTLKLLYLVLSLLSHTLPDTNPARSSRLKRRAGTIASGLANTQTTQSETIQQSGQEPPLKNSGAF